MFDDCKSFEHLETIRIQVVQKSANLCSLSLRILPLQVLNFCTTISKETIISNNSFLSLLINQSNGFIMLGCLLLIEYY